MNFIQAAMRQVGETDPCRVTGRITAMRGLTAHVSDFPMPVGALVRVEPRRAQGDPAFGEVIGSDRAGTMIMLFNATRGLAPGDRVVGVRASQTVSIGPTMLGRVIDAMGRPLDDLGPITGTVPRAIDPDPISALDRAFIHQPLATGVRVVDGMLTAGKGQRLGIFAGPGVGKSTLLGSIARNTNADVSVIALVGERGREVADFIAHALGPEGLAKSVVVVATGDESPLLRIRAAMVATSVAEMFREDGRDVVLMMDSVTRFCQAQRQIGLAVGEPPATKGYTPSVFTTLASLLERAGNVEGGGSITGFYTVLVEGDDVTEPISDAARGILDGHMMLSRKLANRGHYPAVDVLDSVSRVAGDVSTPQHTQARTQIARMLALFSEVEELLNIGAYVRGSNPEYDVAIDFKPRIDALLKQPPDQSAPFEETAKAFVALAVEIGQTIAASGAGRYAA